MGRGGVVSGKFVYISIVCDLLPFSFCLFMKCAEYRGFTVFA